MLVLTNHDSLLLHSEEKNRLSIVNSMFTTFDFEINNKEVTFKNNVFIAANEGDQVKWELAGGIIEKESIVKHVFEPGVHEACMVVNRKRCIVPEERICQEFEIKEK